jgi:hypothetical protein
LDAQFFKAPCAMLELAEMFRNNPEALQALQNSPLEKAIRRMFGSRSGSQFWNVDALHNQRTSAG